MSHNAGYKKGAQMAAEMNGHAKGGRISVKPHMRGPRLVASLTPRVRMPAPPPSAPVMPPAAAMPDISPGMKRGGKVAAKGPPVPTPPSKDIPQNRKARGGAVKGYAKGGKVKGYAAGGYAIPNPPAPVAAAPSVGRRYAMKNGGKVNWIADATKNKGGLHKSLGVPAGEKIPAKKMAAAAKKSGTVGKQARLAETLKSLKK